VKIRDVDTGIKKLNPLPKEGDHKVYRVLCPVGHYIGQTHHSHKPGTTEVGPALVGAMATQLHIDRTFFRDMVGCTKGYDEYLAMRGHDACGH